MIQHFTVLHQHAQVAKNLRHWASSEPSWQWIWPSQRCQSGMQRGGRRQLNWPLLQRPGTGGGAGAQVGTGVSVTVLLATVREIDICPFQSFLFGFQSNKQKTQKHTGLRVVRCYLSGIPVHHCRRDSQRSRHTPRYWWCKLQSRSGSGLVHTSRAQGPPCEEWPHLKTLGFNFGKWQIHWIDF